MAVACLVQPVRPAGAHLAVVKRSLRTLIAESDLVIHGRLVQVDDSVVGAESNRRPALRVEVLDVIKGLAPPSTSLRILQHGHGVAQYAPGEDALLFLRDLRRSRELDGLRLEDGVRWYSNQEHDDGYVLSEPSRKRTLAAARRYASIEEMLPSERDAALRRITQRLLGSRDTRLARSALLDLAASSDLVRENDVAALVTVVHDARTPVDVRIGLLAQLESRGLLEGEDHWTRLLDSTSGSDRLAVVRAVGAFPSQRINAVLVRMLSDPDGSFSSAAALSLGVPRNAEAVNPLAAALESADPRLALAAIRALGRIDTPEAHRVLRAAAESNEDPAIRRRAAAEVELRSRGSD